MPVRAFPEGGIEGTRLRAGLVSDPLTITFRSLAVSRCLGVVARLGLFSELAEQPVRVDDLAQRHALQPGPLRMMLDVLTQEQLLEGRDGAYELAPSARQWLDPESPSSMTTYLSLTLDHWQRWAELDQVAAGGAVEMHPGADDKAAWSRRVRGQYEYARRIGEEVADAVDLPVFAQSIIDVGSAHGWYSAVLCQRNPMLRATVIDGAAAIAVGAELIWEAGMDRVVKHRAGDPLQVELGGPHDAAICLPLLGGLDDEQAMSLLRRTRSALQPGGLLIALRSNHVNDGLGDPIVASTELFIRLGSRVEPTSPVQFRAQLAAGGFGSLRVHELGSAPELSLYVARAI